MKERLLIIWFSLLLGVIGAEAAEAYSYFDTSNGSLHVAETPFCAI